MINKELVDAELKAYNCEVVESNVHQAMLVEIDGKNVIGVNKNWNDEKKLYAILHELGHIRTNSLYSSDASEYIINKCEHAANDSMIEVSFLATEYLYYQSKGYDDSDILKILDMPVELFPEVLRYCDSIKLKYLSDYLEMVL